MQKQKRVMRYYLLAFRDVYEKSRKTGRSYFLNQQELAQCRPAKTF